MMNNRWKRIGYVWKSGMDETCPQCKMQVEEGKVNGGINGSGRQWIHERKMKGGLKHLDVWMVSLDIYSFFSFYFQGIFTSFS